MGVSIAFAPKAISAAGVVGVIANTAGGIASRGLDDDSSTIPLDGTAIAFDAATGGVAGAGTAKMMGLETVKKTGVTRGVGGRVISEALSNTLSPIVGDFLSWVVGNLDSEKNEQASDLSVNCHLTLLEDLEPMAGLESPPLVSSH